MVVVGIPCETEIGDTWAMDQLCIGFWKLKEKYNVVQTRTVQIMYAKH